MFVGFVLCKLTLSVLFSTLYSLEEVTLPRQHLKSRECTSLRVEYLYKLFGVLLHDNFMFSSPFIYELNHFFHINMDSWIFALYFALNPILLYFVAQIVAALPPGSSFCWLVCPSSTAISAGVLCLFFEHVLPFWNYTMLQAHLVWYLPWHQNESFFQVSLVLLLKNGIRE